MALLLISGVAQCQSAPVSRVIIRAGSLWDGVSGRQSAVDILIENGKVESVKTAQGKVDPTVGTHFYDFSDFTIIPGSLATYAVPVDKDGPDVELATKFDRGATDVLSITSSGVTAILLESSDKVVVGGTTAVLRPRDFWTSRSTIVPSLGVSLFIHSLVGPPPQNLMESSWQVRKLFAAPSPDTPAGKIIRGNIVAQFKTPSDSDVARALNIAGEVGIDPLLTNVGRLPKVGLEGRKFSVLLAPPRFDRQDLTWEAFSRLRRMGISVGVASSPAVPLPTTLAINQSSARQFGLSDEDLVRAFTTDAAGIVHAKGLGCLSVACSADFLVIRGNLFDARARIEQVFVEGRKVWDRSSEEFKNIE